MKRIIGLAAFLLVCAPALTFAQECVGDTCTPQASVSVSSWGNLPAPVLKDLLAGAYTSNTKGLIIVEVGSASCQGCKVLLNSLKQKGILDEWKKAGIGFYQYDGSVDAKKKSNAAEYSKTLSGKYQVSVWPSLLFFKNGGMVEGPVTEFNVAAIKATVNRWK